MATVMISIDGKTLRFACEEGDEPRLLSLAQNLGAHINHLKEEHGEIGDYRLAIMAGIMALDEMRELKQRLQSLQAENRILEEQRQEAIKNHAEKEQQTAEKIDAIAQRIIVSAGRIAPKR